jgi:hypothetical protein
MSLDVDILNIDMEIQRDFQMKHDKIYELKQKLQKLSELKSLGSPTLKSIQHNDASAIKSLLLSCTELEQNEENKVKDNDMSCSEGNSPRSVEFQPHVAESINKEYDRLLKTIQTLESNENYNFYIAQTSEILQEYKQLLSIPIKLNFMGKEVRHDKEKQKLIEAYLLVARKYKTIAIATGETFVPQNKKSNPSKISCDNCSNKKDFEVVDTDTYICSQCFSEQIVLKYSSSYKDSDRININTKYTYDRKIHFRDSIMQYMGKQNSTVEKRIYDDLEREFENHYLLQGDKTTDKKVRFKKITKEHVMMFLKDLGHTKHYENINLIHYTMTGRKPDDISHLEDKLMQDFDVLTELYDKHYKNIERKNFINTAFLLYSLLVRHKHPCKKEDFSILKTIDRKNFHDEVIKNLFEHAGWNFTPT